MLEINKRKEIMSEKIALEWDNVDRFKKFIRTFYNCGFNAGKREVIDTGDLRSVSKENLEFKNAEHIDPVAEMILKELSK